MRRVALAGALVAVALLAGSASVLAHSHFVFSDPADGSILEKAPHQVVLVFSSAVATNFTSVDLVEAGGAHYRSTAVRSQPAAPNIVVVTLPDIPKGSYRLTFSTRDTIDLHATTGSIVFGIGLPPPATAPVPQPVPAQPAEVVLRWVALAGLAGVLGGLTLALGVIQRIPAEAAVHACLQRALFGLALLGTGLVVVGETGLLLFQAAALGPMLPTAARLLSGSEFGSRWLLTVLVSAGLIPLLLSLLWASTRKPVRGLLQEIRARRAQSLLSTQLRVVALGVALTMVVAFSGHVAGANGRSLGGVALLIVHVGAMGVWAGGVAALALCMLVLRRAGERLERVNVMPLVIGFGQIAGISFAVLGVSGLLLSGLQVASVTALFSTQYGSVLIAKVLLIGLVALLGLRHALLTWRGLSERAPSIRRLPSRLPLTVTLEAAGALTIVLLASVLGSSAPAQGLQFEPPDSSVAITQLTRIQDGMLITLSVKPSRPGPNLVSAVVANKSWPATPAEAVTVQVERPGDLVQAQTLPTTRSAKTTGTTVGSVVTPMAFDAGITKLDAGDVRFTLTIQRHGYSQSVITVPWRVAALPVPRAPVVISDLGIAPIVNVAAVLAILVAAGLLTAGVVRLRRSRRTQATDLPIRRPVPTHQARSEALTPGHRSVAWFLVIQKRRESPGRRWTRHD